MVVRPGEVVELLPLGEPCAKVDIVGVGEELIELLLVRSVRSLDLAVQLRRRGFDIGVANALGLQHASGIWSGTHGYSTTEGMRRGHRAAVRAAFLQARTG